VTVSVADPEAPAQRGTSGKLAVHPAGTAFVNVKDEVVLSCCRRSSPRVKATAVRATRRSATATETVGLARTQGLDDVRGRVRQVKVVAAVLRSRVTG
jgi:hypothetical protein